MNRTHTPYKGLQPYSEEDAPFFFGREKEVGLIIANLWAWRLMLLYGETGVGKSSLLRAGVAYHLGQLAEKNLKRFDKPKLAVAVFNSWWGDDPIAALKESIQQATKQAWQGREAAINIQARSLSETLQLAAQSVNGRLFVILDQFEEYLLYHQAEGTRGSFDYEFSLAVKEPALPVSFLISIRAEMLAKLDRVRSQLPDLFENTLRITFPNIKAARDLLMKSLEHYNQLFASEDKTINIEPSLIDAVLQQVKSGQVIYDNLNTEILEESVHVEVPFLQLVMSRIWEEEMKKGSRVLRLETFMGLGGAAKIFSRHLDVTMSGFSYAERRVAAQIFKYLVTPSGVKLAYSVHDLASFTNLPEEQVARMLETLSDGSHRVLRLLEPAPDKPNVRRYEVLHDILGPAILDWRRRVA